MLTEPPRPVVHVGFHKTGSTWFQHVFYPASTSHSYIPLKVVRAAFLNPPGLVFDASKASALLQDAAGGKPVLICDEALSGSYVAGGLHGMFAPEMARRIKCVLPDAQIVIGIRAQPSMLAACYSQYVKNGGTSSIRRFLFPNSYFFAGSPCRFAAPRFDFSHFEYQRLIAFYQKLFDGRVHIIPFEAFRVDPLAQAMKMAALTSISVTASNIHREIKNPSLTPGALRIVRFLNLFTAHRAREKSCIIHIPGVYRLRKYLYGPLNRLFPSRHLTPEERLGSTLTAWIEARFASANRELTAVTNLDLAPLGYPLLSTEHCLKSPLPRWRAVRAT